MDIFISWSKTTSREISLLLKEFIEKFFRSRKVSIYLSDAKMEPGDTWFDALREAISRSSLCIIVLTDENELSRWIYFEAGAIAFNKDSSRIVPLLVTSRAVDQGSPLMHYQHVHNNFAGIERLFRLIKRVGKLTGVREDEFNERFESHYAEFARRVDAILERSITQAGSTIPFGHVFPQSTQQIEAGTVFVGAPMAAHRSAVAYAEAQAGMRDVLVAIDVCCGSVRRAYWAGADLPTPDRFDGEQTALIRDLGHLKSSEACVFILFEKLPTSVYVEVGYAIALNKKIVIFCRSRDDLPFLLKRADKKVTNLAIYECSSYHEITEMIDKDGDAIIGLV